MPYDDLPPEREGCLPPAFFWLFVVVVVVLAHSLTNCSTPPPNVTQTTDGVHTTVIVTYPPQKDLLSQLLDTALTYGKSLYTTLTGGTNVP